jgi:hypothetical protein
MEIPTTGMFKLGKINKYEIEEKLRDTDLERTKIKICE